MVPIKTDSGEADRRSPLRASEIARLPSMSRTRSNRITDPSMSPAKQAPSGAAVGAVPPSGCPFCRRMRALAWIALSAAVAAVSWAGVSHLSYLVFQAYQPDAALALRLALFELTPMFPSAPAPIAAHAPVGSPH